MPGTSHGPLQDKYLSREAAFTLITSSMYSVPATSRVILDSLLKDDRLSLPSEVVAFANDVVYSGNDLPYLRAFLLVLILLRT